jgi:hypothetical protein
MITNAAKKHIHESNMSIVIVGDTKKIEPGLRTLNIPIIHSDAYGNIMD